MYRTRDATLPNDKVYGLLGMNSDDPGATDLSADYTISWEVLFRQLVEAVLGRQVYARTNDEAAVIEARACAFGRGSLVDKETTSNDTQKVEITSKDGSGYLGGKTQWTLQASVEPIQEGDLVCYLQGASRPTILRPQEDYFIVIMISVTPPET
ncbi:hypothetical protein DL771_000292 [Monosporascus sp. 5C6A]|nr:hypothetical protein DL771_000292 [Monosporascus sp. 5C6A]